MLNTTLNSALWIIRTVFLYSDGKELSVVDCTYHHNRNLLYAVTYFTHPLKQKNVPKVVEDGDSPLQSTLTVAQM